MAARPEDTVAHGSTQEPQENTAAVPLTDSQIMAENVKNLKRKVISVAKLKEIFDKKDQGREILAAGI